MTLSSLARELKIYFVRFLHRRSKTEIVCFSFFLVFGISILDYLTGPELSLSIFYLIPIFFVEGTVGSYWGFVISLLSAMGWFLADFLWRRSIQDPFITPWNFLVMAASFLIFDYVIASLREALLRERKLARVDSLTGVSNRRSFMESVRAELLRSRRSSECVTLAYLDIDNFKQINDQFGHLAGDAVLVSVAKSIVSHIRATDIVARLGGDEFAILLPQMDPRNARLVLSKLLASLREGPSQSTGPISVSIGAMTFQETPTSVDEMIIKADALMYEVKMNGKGDLICKVEPSGVELSRGMATLAN